MELLQRSVLSVGGSKVDLNTIQLLLFSRLVDAYVGILRQWDDFLHDEIYEYIQVDSYSAMQWSILKSAGVGHVFGDTLSTEQKVWIYNCTANDKEQETKFILSVRESILPWLDSEMWSNMQKMKKDKRENKQYDTMHKLMIEGQLDQLESAARGEFNPLA
jgi:hypothetical protein